MATMYYNDATGDHLWSTLGNWWTTSPGVGAAATLPAVGDTVLLTGAVTQSSYSATVANLTITNFTLIMNLTVSGSATFAGTAKNGALSVVTGSTVFNSTAENLLGATVIGACTFNTSAKNYGKVTGTVICNNASTNESGGIIEGSCALNSTSQNKLGAVIKGEVVMSTSSVCAGTINGYTQMHNSSSVTSDGIVNGNLEMDGTSTFSGTMNGYGLTVDSATLAAGAVANCTAALIPGGTISGTLNCTTAAFSSGGSISATGILNISGAGSFYGSFNSGVINGVGTILFIQYSYNYGTVGCAYAKFQDYSENLATPTVGTVNCNVDFVNQCYNRSAVVAGIVDFDETSTNEGTVASADCRIRRLLGNDSGTITGTANFYGNASFPEFGSNGNGTVVGVTNSYWPAIYPVGGSVSGATNYIGYNFVNARLSDTEYLTGGLGFLSTVKVLGVTLSDCETFKVGINSPMSVKSANLYIGEQFTCSLTPADAGFTVKQALEAIYSVWGSGCADGCETSTSAKGKAALDILNGCMQEILLNAKELQYLSRETIDVSSATLDSNNGFYYYLLPDNVQTVVGPVLLKTTSSVGSVAVRRQIIGVSTKSQLLNFASYYNTGGKTAIYGYFIERGYQETGDRSRVRVYVSARITSAILRMDVEREALRYRAGDCNTGTVIPIPHQYAESLLLPLLREAASASTYASRRDAFPMHQAAAAAARTRFAMADPQNPILEPQPERKRKP